MKKTGIEWTGIAVVVGPEFRRHGKRDRQITENTQQLKNLAINRNSAYHSPIASIYI